MIGRTNTGGGGGSGGLNFRVIGGTSAPSVPKENDIWVNTDIGVTEWFFAVEEPGFEKVSEAGSERNKFINTNGALTQTANGFVTDFIQIPEGCTEIVVKTGTDNTGGYCHAFYDKDTQLLGLVERENTDTAYSVPDGAKSVRFTFLYTDAPKVRYLEPSNGLVWISTGTSSTVKFNALKKNGIEVYPISAKQYVGGAWVDKDAKIYQGGEWAQFSFIVTTLYLYDAGNTNDEVTGGWTSTDKNVFKSDHIEFIISASWGGHQVFTNNAIDMSRYKTINVKVSNWNKEGYFGISLQKPNTNPWNSNFTNKDNCQFLKTISGDGTIQLDISEAEGEYYFWAGMPGQNDPNNPRGFYIHYVLLESGE